VKRSELHYFREISKHHNHRGKIIQSLLLLATDSTTLFFFFSANARWATLMRMESKKEIEHVVIVIKHLLARFESD
jgi:hypothetical protein